MAVHARREGLRRRLARRRRARAASRAGNKPAPGRRAGAAERLRQQNLARERRRDRRRVYKRSERLGSGPEAGAGARLLDSCNGLLGPIAKPAHDSWAQ